MVAVVSGSSLGLFNSSLSLLGSGGALGSSGEGRGNERLYVNSANGNLVVQSRDEYLSAIGADLSFVRTYNSQGLLNDDNADNWRIGVYQSVVLNGTLNAAGSTVTKTFGDGSAIVYTLSATNKYVSTDGDGAHDTLEWNASTSQWTWTDGSTRATEIYNSTGKITASKDASGNTTSYSYTGNLITQITDSAGQNTFLDYTGNNLTQIRVVSNGVTQTLVRYGYDGQNRLQTVKVDMSPGDNSVTDNDVYLTTYAYDGTSNRILSISQGHNSTIGNVVSFTYQQINGAWWLKTYTDGENKTTTMTYSGVALGQTSANANTGILSTTDNVTTNYNLNTGALTAPTSGWAGAALRESSSTAAGDPKIAYDANGNAFLIWVEGDNLQAQRYTRATGTWSSTVTLDTNANAASNTSLSVDSAGNALAAWVQSDGTAASVYASRFDATSGTWGTATLLDTLSANSTFPVNTAAGTLATSISGARAAVTWLHNTATSGGTYNLYVARLNAGTWAAPDLVETRAGTVMTPSIATDEQGNTTVIFQQNDGTANSVYANRFTFSTGTWSGQALRESSATAAAEPKIAFDANGNGVLIWLENNNLQAQRYTRSTDTWSATVTLDNRSSTVFNSALSVDTGGNAIAAWVQSDGTANSVYAARLDFASGTWGTATLLDTIAANSTFPVNTATATLATSINGNRSAVAWQHNTATSGSTYNMYVARYDGGWITPDLVESSANTAAMQSVAIDNQGNATVVFQQNDGTANSIYANRYTSTLAWKYTVPSGATWQSIANALYGVNSAAAGSALQSAMGNPALVTGNVLTGWPTTLSVTAPGTVPAYYTVQTGDSWPSIALAIYGTNDAGAVSALQTATGSPTLAAGVKITVPLTLTYTASNALPIAATIDIQSSLGLVTTIQNDSQGRLWKVLSPTVGGVRLETRYEYDGEGNLLRVIEDPTGANRITTFTYLPGTGLLDTTRDALGNSTKRTYNATNQLVTESHYTGPDPDGDGSGLPTGALTTRYAYDSLNRLRFIVSPEGRVTEYRYNSNGTRSAAIVYTAGHYDVSALAATDPISESALTTWTGTQTLTLIQRTDYAYDFRGNVITATAFQSTDSSGNGVASGSLITRFVYDQRGLLLSTIDPRGETTPGVTTDYLTTYTYDGLGRQRTQTEWLVGSTTRQTTTVYDDDLNRTTVTFANGLVTTSVFDKRGLLVSTINSNLSSQALGTTTYIYDADRRLRGTVSPTGAKQYLLYDDASRQIAAIDGDGTLTETVYDRLGQAVKTVVYADRVPQATRDSLIVSGVPAAVTLATVKAAVPTTVGRASDQITRLVYDAAGRVVYTIDPSGYVTQNFYDGTGRTTDTVRYFNATGSIASTVDELRPVAAELVAGNALTTRTFNNASGTLVSSLTLDSANDRRQRNFYSADGLLLGTLDAAGYLTEYKYDDGGRLTQQIAYANLTDSTKWNAGTLDQLRPALDNETATDPERDANTYFYYDHLSRKIGVLDAEGFLTETTYNEASLAATVTRYDHPGGLTYNADFATLKAPIVNGDNRWTSFYTYDGGGRVTQLVERRGTTTAFAEVVTTSVYDTIDNVTTRTTAATSSEARTVQARYDELGRVTQELTAEGSAAIASGTPVATAWAQYSVTHTYDLAGHRKDTTDQNGNKTRFFYDADDRLVYTVNALGEVTETRYNALDQVSDVLQYATRITSTNLAALVGGTDIASLTAVLVTTGANASTSYTYKLNGQTATVSTAEGALTTYTRNAFGEVTQQDVKLNPTETETHTYQYNKQGLATLTRWDPNGINRTETDDYDAFGRLKSSTDQYGAQNRFEYDRLGRVIATYDPLNHRHRTTYDAFDRVYDTYDAYENKTTYRYDDSLRQMVVTTPEGVAITTVQNRYGQTFTVTSNGNTTTYLYDPNGQLQSVSDGLGPLESRLYDKAGRETDRTAASGAVTHFAYDAANRVWTRTEDYGDSSHLNLTTTFAYDALGRTSDVTEPSGRLTHTDYDKDGRITQVTVDPSGLNLRTVYTYDNAGRTITVTEGAGSSNPRRTKYVYDKLGRRTHEYADSTDIGGTLNLHTEYRYDRAGNLYRKIDPSGYSTWYVYDTDSRVIQTLTTLDMAKTQVSVVAQAYDDEDRVVATRHYVSTVGVPSTDQQLTPVSMGSAAYSREQTVYDRDGRAVYSIGANYAVTERTFDAAGNVTREHVYANPIAAPSTDLVTVSGVITALGSANGVVAAGDRVRRSVYDLRNRLEISVDASGAVTQFKYDNAGNIVQKTELAATVPMDAAMRVWFVPSTNSSASRPLGTFNAGDVVTATVRFKSSSDTSGRVFLGDAGGPNPYDNSVVSAVVYGNDGWITITVTQTMSHADDMWIYVYGDRDGAAPTPAHNVIYDNVKVTSTQRGTVLDDNFDGGFAAWSISGNATAVSVSMADSGSDASLRAFVTSLANSATDHTTRFWYDKTDRVRFALDSEGYLKETRYLDSTRKQVEVVYAAKPTIGAGADLAAVVAAAGGLATSGNQTTTNQYDLAGRLQSVTASGSDIADRVESYTYDAVGNKKTFVNANNKQWDYTYDGNHRLIWEDAPAVDVTTVSGTDGSLPTPGPAANLRIRTTYEYDARGNLTARIEASNTAQSRRTEYTYDGEGHQLTTTLPPVGVYNGSQADITATGTGVTRQETLPTSLTTTTDYDALGNAWRNKDTAGFYSYKLYDLAGRVTIEIDAKGYVTQHEYDTFGNEFRLTRYANAYTGTAPTSGSSTITLPTASADDRQILTTYDRLNRATKVEQPAVYVWDSTPLANAYGGTGHTDKPTTVYQYDAFGHVVLERKLISTSPPPNTYADTYHYYDRRGMLVADVDALGFLTKYEYDETGDLTRKVEFANALSWWNIDGYANPEAVASGVAENVSDTIANGVTVTGTSAAKTTGTDAWDSGFRSKVGYTGGATVTFTVPQNNKYLMVGLNSDPTSDNSYASIDYALYCYADGSLYVYESGSGVGPLGTYVAGDVLSVSYDGQYVRYLKNGVAFRQVAVTISQPLYADSSLYSVGGRVDNIDFQGRWVVRDGVTVQGESAKKLGPSGDWSGGFTSTKGYTGGASIGWTVSQTDAYVMVGLNSDPLTDSNYASLDYAFYTAADGNLYIYESGSNVGNYGPYNTGDSFRIVYDGAKIRYLRNGVALREVTVAISGALYADSSFYTQGGEVTNLQFGRSADDRESLYTYDSLNRRTSETLIVDPNGGLSRERATTTFGYDAVGNRVSESMGGATTYTYYDALGRVIAIAEPARDVDGAGPGGTLIPLTVIRRDARGNAVEQIQYANGTASASATSYTTPVASGSPSNPDRDTILQFDALDRVIQVRDGVNAYRFTSYNARGDVAKEWQPTTNNSGTTETIVTRYTYDEIGRQIRVEEPQTLGGTNVIVDRSITYNSFGEVIGKTIVGGGAGDAEINKYDQAGRLWFSNSGDGVDKIYLYNLAGQATAVIRSRNSDLNAVSLAQVQAGLVGITQMRTETVYDLLGHVVEQRDVSFTSQPTTDAMAGSFNIGKPIDSRLFVYWSAPPSGISQSFSYRVYPSGSWSSPGIVNLGNGYYGVDVTGLNNTYEFRVTLTRPGDSAPYAVHTGTFTASTTNSVALTVSGGSTVGTITGLAASVSGTSVSFTWTPGPAGNATLEVKPTSSSTWQSVPGTLYSDGYSTSFMVGTVTGITPGSYDYRITYVSNGLTTAVGSGTLTVTAQTSSTTGSASPAANWGNAIGTLTAATSGGGATSVSYSWASPGGTQTFKYKVQGTSTWTDVTISGGNTANIGTLASGTYDFQYQYTTYDPIYGQPNGGGTATGYFVVNGLSSSSTTTSTSGTPPTMNFNPSTPPITTTFSWPVDGSIAGSPTFYWRTPGGSWNSVAPSVSGGFYRAAVNNLNGSYEWYVGYSTAWAQGTFSVSGFSVSITSQTGSPSYLAGVTASGNRLYWSRALTNGDTLTVTLNGSTSLAPQTSDGTNYSASFDGIATGTYNYEIAYTKNGQKYVSNTGTISITTTVTPAGASVTAPVGPGTITGFQEVSANSGLLGWTTAATAGDTIVFRYRATGATTWAGTLTAVPWGSGFYVDWGPSLTGSFQYEVMYMHSGTTTPYRVANGSTTITRSVNSSGTNLADTTSAAPERQPASLVTRLRQQLDRWGDVVAFTDAAAQTTNYRYNARGQVTQVRSPRVQAVSTLNNAIGSATNLRPTSSNFYDAFGRLIATVDANGNRNRLTLNAAGQVVAETLADATSFTNTTGGTTSYWYNAFGDRVQVTDALGFKTRNVYDAVGQLTNTSTERIASAFQFPTDPFTLSGVTANLISHLYTYDQAGRRKTETSGEVTSGGAPETTQYWYDLLGNLVTRRSARSFYTTYEYDPFGNGKQTKQTDAILGVMTWTYDAWGRLKQHIDITGDQAGDSDNATITYNYDDAGMLTSTTDTRGRSTTYTYDGVGHVTSIVESGAALGLLTALNRTTTYTYDVAGRVTREKVVVDNVVQQDTTTTYDALGRITHLSDPRYTLSYQYDAAGNRTHITSNYFDQTGTGKASDLWYSYDGANRVTISQGVNSSGTIVIGTQGIELTYNARGERATARQYATTLTHYTGAVGVYPSPNPVPIDKWQEAAGEDLQRYTYDGAGRLTMVERNVADYFVNPNGTGSGITGYHFLATDTRTYDGASRQISQTQIVVQTPPYTDQYIIPYITRVNASTYDDDGRLLTQTTSKNGVAESSVLYGDAVYNAGGLTGDYVTDPWGNQIWYEYNVPATWSKGWDPAGNLRGYTVTVYNTSTASPTDVAYTQNFSMTYRSGESYQELSESVANVNGTTTAPLSGYTSRTYNLAGELVQFTDSQDQNKNRYFANNSMGQALNILTGNYGSAPVFSEALAAIGAANAYKLQSVLVANGQQVGSLQSGGTGGLFKASFDVNYEPISDDFPGNVPAEVIAQEGDTLRIVAARVFGDASLWYLIAQENGLSDPDAVVQTGRVLRIPNDVVSVSNTSSSFKPYDVKAAIGDTTPTQPMPPPPKARKKGCGVLGMILVIVVVIVVTYLSWGSGTGWAAGLGQSIAGSGAGGAIAGGAIAGAAGSVAGQFVGLATGVQDKFDWKGVAMGAIGGAVTLGAFSAAANAAAAGETGVLASAGRGLSAIGVAGRAAVGSILTQGIGVATGVQSSFSWREVALSAGAAAAADAVGNAVGQGIDPNFSRAPGYNNFGATLGSELAGGLAGQLVRAAFGGKVDAATIIADAFGNALANSIGAKLAGAPQPIRSADDQSDSFLESYNAKHPNAAADLFPDLEFGSVTDSLDLNPDIGSAVDTPDDLREIAITAQKIPTHQARSGESISTIVGTSNPVAVEAFMRANYLSDSTIYAGQTYRMPGDADYAASNGALGQQTLNADNMRLREIAEEQQWDARISAAFNNPDSFYGTFATAELTGLSMDQVLGMRADAAAAQLAASRPQAPRMVQREVYTAMGDYAGTEWVEDHDIPYMSYADQMYGVGQVFVGAGKGVVNGVPVLLTDIGKGWGYIGASIDDGVSSALGLRSNYLDRTISAFEPVTGQVLPYTNVEQRLGGFAGELVSPGAYLKAGAATLKVGGMVLNSGRLFAAATGDALYSVHESFMARMGLQTYVVPPEPIALLTGPSLGKINAVRGNEFESLVRDALRAEKGTDLFYSIESKIGTIPDLPIGARFGVTDAKDVISLSNSSQLRVQLEAALQIRKPFSLVISPRTQVISRPLQGAIASTGGRIFQFDSATGKFSDVILKGNKVIR